MNNAEKDWLKLLNPDSLKNNLIRVSIFVSAFEVLKRTIIERPREFFISGFSSDGSHILDHDKYKKNVLVLYPINVFIASCKWFVAQNAISDYELTRILKIRDHRNQIVHEMLKFLGMVEHEVDLNLFNEMQNISSKLDIWWIREIEIPTNPDMDDVEVDSIPDSEIQSGNMVIFQLISSLLYDKEHELRSIYEYYKNQFSN